MQLSGLLRAISILFASVILAACASVNTEAIRLASTDLSGKAVQLKLDIYRPPIEPPYPVVIDLHGCSGIVASRQRMWVERMRSWGYALIKSDGFSPRGDSNICDDTLKISPYERLADVENTLRYILAADEFDHNNIFLMGMSHGATTALAVHQYPRPLFAKLNGVIAFYPYCSHHIPALLSDTLILIGGRDDWTPAEYCQQMIVSETNGYELELIVYPNAYHSFDVPTARGTYYGHKLLYDKAVAEDSGLQVKAFLSEHRR